MYFENLFPFLFQIFMVAKKLLSRFNRNMSMLNLCFWLYKVSFIENSNIDNSLVVIIHVVDYQTLELNQLQLS